MIGIRTALILFGLLAAASFVCLTGLARYFCLIIVAGLAAKAIVHHYRKRFE
jgi:uncharacterized membrane protein